ncbi:MAG: hypothetical protein U9Q63_02565, partial [Patescibacteria group bacterium]|nr:hypothetical protein [Patescibacteria group bacterium]
LEKYRLLENGIDEVILTGPDGENYRAYFDDNGKVRCDEKVTEKYTNKNLSEGKFENTLIIILEGKSIGGDFPADADASFTAIGDLSKMTLAKGEQLMGRGMRTGEQLIFDGFIAVGKGAVEGLTREGLVDVLKVNTEVVQKSLNHDLLLALQESSARKVIYDQVYKLMDQADGQLTPELEQGLKMLAELDHTLQGLETNIFGKGVVPELEIRRDRLGALVDQFKKFIYSGEYGDFMNSLSQEAKAEFISNSEVDPNALIYTVEGNGADFAKFFGIDGGLAEYLKIHREQVRENDVVKYKLKSADSGAVQIVYGMDEVKSKTEELSVVGQQVGQKIVYRVTGLFSNIARAIQGVALNQRLYSFANRTGVYQVNEDGQLTGVAMATNFYTKDISVKNLAIELWAEVVGGLKIDQKIAINKSTPVYLTVVKGPKIELKKGTKNDLLRETQITFLDVNDKEITMDIEIDSLEDLVKLMAENKAKEQTIELGEGETKVIFNYSPPKVRIDEAKGTNKLKFGEQIKAVGGFIGQVIKNILPTKGDLTEVESVESAESAEVSEVGFWKGLGQWFRDAWQAVEEWVSGLRQKEMDVVEEEEKQEGSEKIGDEELGEEVIEEQEPIDGAIDSFVISLPDGVQSIYKMRQFDGSSAVVYNISSGDLPVNSSCFEVVDESGKKIYLMTLVRDSQAYLFIVDDTGGVKQVQEKMFGAYKGAQVKIDAIEISLKPYASIDDDLTAGQENQGRLVLKSSEKAKVRIVPNHLVSEHLLGVNIEKIEGWPFYYREISLDKIQHMAKLSKEAQVKDGKFGEPEVEEEIKLDTESDFFAIEFMADEVTEDGFSPQIKIEPVVEDLRVAYE